MFNIDSNLNRFRKKSYVYIIYRDIVMWERFIITMKISSLSNKIKCMENDIMKYRNDMALMNDLYYCGRGDVDTYINEWSQAIHFKILACERLMLRYDRKLSKLNGVVGKS